MARRAKRLDDLKNKKPIAIRRKTSTQRGYDRRWRRAAAEFLARHPLCKQCSTAERPVAATCVDHIIPHRGDRQLFWNVANFQALCEKCHNRKTAAGQ